MKRSQNNNIMLARVSMFAMALLLLGGFVSAQSFSTFFNGSSDVVIVVGADAAQSDTQTAQMISQSIKNEDSRANVRIMTDDDVSTYIEDSISGDNSSSEVKIISVGGSCVNKLTAATLGLQYPSCGAQFMEQTNAGPGEYLVQTEKASVLNTEGNASGDSLTVTVVAGYSAADTLNSASALNSTGIEFEAGQSEVLASANVGINLSDDSDNDNNDDNSNDNGY